MNRNSSQLAPIVSHDTPDTEGTLDYIFNHRRTSSARFGVHSYTITGPISQSRPPRPLLIALLINGASAWIETSHQLIYEACAHQNPDIPLYEVPEAYRGIYIEAIFADLLITLESLCEAQVTISHVYDKLTDAGAGSVFSSPPQSDYNILSFEVKSPTNELHPVALKIGNDQLPILARLLS